LHVRLSARDVTRRLRQAACDYLLHQGAQLPRTRALTRSGSPVFTASPAARAAGAEEQAAARGGSDGLGSKQAAAPSGYDGLPGLTAAAVGGVGGVGGVPENGARASASRRHSAAAAASRGGGKIADGAMSQEERGLNGGWQRPALPSGGEGEAAGQQGAWGQARGLHAAREAPVLAKYVGAGGGRGDGGGEGCSGVGRMVAHARALEVYTPVVIPDGSPEGLGDFLSSLRADDGTTSSGRGLPF